MNFSYRIRGGDFLYRRYLVRLAYWRGSSGDFLSELFPLSSNHSVRKDR